MIVELVVAEREIEQVKPGFTNYQPQPKYSWALSKIEGKGKLVKPKFLEISGSLKISENLKKSERLKNSQSLKSLKLSERILRFTTEFPESGFSSLDSKS